MSKFSHKLLLCIFLCAQFGLASASQAKTVTYRGSFENIPVTVVYDVTLPLAIKMVRSWYLTRGGTITVSYGKDSSAKRMDLEGPNAQPTSLQQSYFFDSADKQPIGQLWMNGSLFSSYPAGEKASYPNFMYLTFNEANTQITDIDFPQEFDVPVYVLHEDKTDWGTVTLRKE